MCGRFRADARAAVAGWRWAPDGKHIAYWQLDASGVGDFAITSNIRAKADPGARDLQASAARPRLRRPQRRRALAPRLWRTTMTCSTAPTTLGGCAPLGRTPPPSSEQRHQLRRPTTPRSRVPRPTRTVQLIERVKAGWCRVF